MKTRRTYMTTTTFTGITPVGRTVAGRPASYQGVFNFM